MRQLLRKHSSEDGEIEDYLQTGAFEKRSNEMRLFSLDGTTQVDIQNMIELSQSNCADDAIISEKKGQEGLTPNKDFAAGNNSLLNLVQKMDEPYANVRSPEILNQMRHKIIFSGELKGESGDPEEDLDEEESQLSSPEMNCTQTESKVTTKNASMKTKDQHEIQAIIATTKQFTVGDANPINTVDDYNCQVVNVGSQNLHLQDYPQHGAR